MPPMSRMCSRPGPSVISKCLEGELDAEARKRLLEIADKCPVHRTLTSEIDIRTTEEPAQSAAR